MPRSSRRKSEAEKWLLREPSTAALPPSPIKPGTVGKVLDFVKSMRSSTDLPGPWDKLTEQQKNDFLLNIATAGVGGMIKKYPIAFPKGSLHTPKELIRSQMIKNRQSMTEPVSKVGKEIAEKYGDWLPEIYRGTWFHGRRTYPAMGDVYSGARTNPGNLGEPLGISLSAAPSVPIQFSHINPRQEKLRDILYKRASSMHTVRTKQLLEDRGLKHSEPYIARVMPRYGGSPEDRILLGWKGGHPEHEKLYRDAYKKAIKSNKLDIALAEAFPNISKASKESLYRKLKSNVFSSPETRVAFNRALTENLQREGYRGTIYSPARYNEYELRMFNPSDVMNIDVRPSYDPNMHNVPRSKRRKIYSWADAAAPHEDSALGAIYKDIDLQSMAREVDTPNVARLRRPGIHEKELHNAVKEHYLESINLSSADALEAFKKLIKEGKELMQKYPGYDKPIASLDDYLDFVVWTGDNKAKQIYEEALMHKAPQDALAKNKPSTAKLDLEKILFTGVEAL